MDPRNGPAHHAWSRPHSQSTPPDPRLQATTISTTPRYTAIQDPPAPSTPSSVQRPQTYFNNDLFLSRKSDHHAGRAPDQQMSNPPFPGGGGGGAAAAGVQQLPYGASVARREASGPLRMPEKAPERQSSWTRSADGRNDRYTPPVTEAPSSQLPPPPPPSSAYRPSLEAFHVSDDPMRQAGPRTSSPRMYGVAPLAAQSSLPPPPPPPPPPPAVPYGNRHIRRPSSPPYGPAPLHRDHPSQSPIGRDLPAPSATTRSAGSMSILSMLGTDPGRPLREPPTSTRPSTAQPVSSSTSVMQYSPPAVSPSKASYNGKFELQGSPPTQNAISGRPFRAYSGGSVGSGKMSSPSANALRFGHLPTESPSFPQSSPRSAGATERMPEHGRHMSAARAIGRPNSQPAGHHPPAIDFDQKAREIDAKRAELARQEEALARSGTGFSDRSRSSTFDLLGRQRSDASRHAAQPATQGSTPDGRVHSGSYPFLSNASFNEPTTKGSRAEYSYTPRDRVANDAQDSQPVVQKSPFDADALRRLREERLGATAIQQPQELNRTPSSARPRFLDTFESRPEQAENRRLSSVSSATAMERTRSIDSLGRNSEELNNHRHSLAIMLDNGKRGRVSPLPQAVQGAQGRPSNTPSRDPGIKNEFAKMFAGIGSGVTGVGGSGTSTPFPPSPRQSVENEQRPFGPPSDVVKITESRNGSRMGKRRNKIKGDEVDNRDGRLASVSADGRGIKRVKHSHRHHIHGHHHHRDEGTPLRTVSNPSGSTPTPHHSHHVHHHHHADGTIHHHHHTQTKQPAPAIEKPPPPPRMPKSIIINEPTLSAIANHPRHHLGSVIYAPTTPALSSHTSLQSKKINDTNITMASSYMIPPQYSRRENCTLTVRVPRFYLSHSSLQHITSLCAIWGTDIYTDDSDPVCAAIHAGWIRGAWPANIDVDMLEPGLKAVSLTSDDKESQQKGASKDKDKDTTTTATRTRASGGSFLLDAPSPSSERQPSPPPPRKDMLLTLLMLPALESYASRVVHGVKSRPWGDDHAGGSFRVERVAFVDGGDGEERGARGRKERIAAAAAYEYDYDSLAEAEVGGGGVASVAKQPPNPPPLPAIRLGWGRLTRPTTVMKSAVVKSSQEVVAVA